MLTAVLLLAASVSARAQNPPPAPPSGSASEAKAGTPAAAPTKPPAVGTSTTSGAAAAPESAAGISPGSAPAAGRGTVTETATVRVGPAAAPAGKRPVRRAAVTGRGAIAQSPAHLDERVTYHYNALGRRDPFQSLLSGEYVGADVGGQAPPDVGGFKVVGIVWGDVDQFALVEDGRGDSHILRRGDKVMNGYVESLKRDAIIVNLTLDGQAQSVRIPLTRKGDKTNATR